MICSIPLAALLAASSGQDPAWTQAKLEATSAEIQKDVEELRGVKFLRPVKVKLSDTAGLRDYMRQREAAMASPGRLHRDECTAKLLGLVAPGLDLRALEMEVLEGQVGGFYDPSSDTFFLMDAMKGAVAKVILAHELTHALDDQLHDIDAVLKAANDETDAELAIRSVIEGSGTNLMNRWTVAHGKEIPASEMQELSTMGADALRKAPPLLWKPLIASYFAGDGFLSRGGGMNLTMKPADPADVDRAFREPPRSTEQILHPERYWDAGKRDEPVRVKFDTRKLPEGWTELAQDTLGEMALALLTTPVAERKGFDMSNPMSVLGLKFTNEPAKGWGGDRLILLGRGDDRFLQLVTVWDSVKDAGEFVGALEKVAPKLFAGPRDAAAGWVARFTPTHFDVNARQDVQSPVFVVVRAASFTAADDTAFAGLDVPWSSGRESKDGPAGSGKEPGGSAKDGR
ncbi:MAG: hypothetical protein NTY35_09445 [Planctomycetota bacterium]|nr:hypothetical protein [Planctomycetota bacterium]